MNNRTRNALYVGITVITILNFMVLPLVWDRKPDSIITILLVFMLLYMFGQTFKSRK